MLAKLHASGIKAEHMYLAGFASIGLSFTSWFLSRHLERAGMARADRWGIFIGEWAPTFFAIGNGLQMYEKR
ncbi:hypothetical protein AB0H57_03005 [Micromonospora sp. NPDC050686]|uniref:hypothetical protein n=1 Tax=Micromonospora sp. NPDC050686 TaxID=3154631 RepID=UPI003403A388